MYLSAFLTSLPTEVPFALYKVARLGFTHVDMVAVAERSEDDREALASSGLLVSCMALGRDLPEGCALDEENPDKRLRAVLEVKKQIADAAQLGATHVYLVPCKDTDTKALRRFSDGCAELADYASGRMMQLCVEHVPGRALPSVAALLKWLEDADLADVKMLLDIGHCLITEEEPAQAVAQAGDRLGYVHLDDNDSIGDLHWPLLTGRLTYDMLDAFLAILKEFAYKGGVALELNPQNEDPVRALREGKEIFERMIR
jgi:sugar phosphate isomerase/epimerase